MTPNVKEHAYLIKNRDDKRGCDRDDDPLMVYWDIQYVFYEKTLFKEQFQCLLVVEGDI